MMPVVFSLKFTNVKMKDPNKSVQIQKNNLNLYISLVHYNSNFNLGAQVNLPGSTLLCVCLQFLHFWLI